MSEENVETVRRVYKGVNARLEAPWELFDPDYEFDNMELWPDVVEVLGFEAAQQAMREYWETFEAYRVEIEEVIYADDGRVVDEALLWAITGTDATRSAKKPRTTRSSWWPSMAPVRSLATVTAEATSESSATVSPISLVEGRPSDRESRQSRRRRGLPPLVPQLLDLTRQLAAGIEAARVSGR